MPPSPNPLIENLTGEAPIVDWILPDFLPRGVLTAIAGAPGSGKSFLFYSIGLALSSGIPIIGFRPSNPFRVLYFDQENSTPDRIQYERWAWQGLGCPSLERLAANFWEAPFVLGGADWQAKAANAIDLRRPDLIVIDTTTPALAIKDENDNAEATRVIGQIRELMAAYPPLSVIALKHAKIQAHDGSYTLRGAKAWEGAVDSIAYVKKAKGRPYNGLSDVFLHPAKTRAFGLRDPIRIHPAWIDEGRGIRLTGAPCNLHDDESDEASI